MKTKTTSLKAKLNSAFSLVELLVVIAVIAVIAAIAIPNIVGTRDAAVNAKTAANREEQTRFINNVNAVGATNSSGNAATTNNVTNGASFSALVGTNTVTFTYTVNE